MTLNFHPDLRRSIESALVREIEAHHWVLNDLQNLWDDKTSWASSEARLLADARMAVLRQRMDDEAYVIVGLTNALDDLRKEQ